MQKAEYLSAIESAKGISITSLELATPDATAHLLKQRGPVLAKKEQVHLEPALLSCCDSLHRRKIVIRIGNGVVFGYFGNVIHDCIVG